MVVLLVLIVGVANHEVFEPSFSSFFPPPYGGSDPTFIVTRASSPWRKGQPQLARRRQKRVRGLLMTSSRMGPLTGALNTKEGRVLPSFVRSCTVSVFNHQNGQTALYVAPLCPFIVISSPRGVVGEGLSCLGSRTPGIKDTPFLGSVWGAKEAGKLLPPGELRLSPRSTCEHALQGQKEFT